MFNRLFRKKKKETKESIYPLTYHSTEDNEREEKIKELMEVVLEYFIPYEEEEYKGEENKNILHYRMVELRNYVSSKYKHNVHPIFLDNLRNYNSTMSLRNKLYKLSDKNLNSLYTIFKDFKNKRNKIN